MMRLVLRRLLPALALVLAPAVAHSLDVVSLPQGTGAAGIAVAADGTVWFSAQFSGALGRVSPAGEVALFPFPSRGTQPLAVALQPDGTAWGADLAGERLGRVAPDGSFTEIPLGRAGGSRRGSPWRPTGSRGSPFRPRGASGTAARTAR